ncbi:hypothetical protein [Natronococcus occultus]|uniref:DUF7982 domain-containing protein n=1 Tax=Natronococcus occultus SP4 TaxID=694430 RepID=L0K011_9EURY|nr:hypothetical protein [Natronococcus occultus]AGB38642.1 hypothetical protein Natoc_2884 [Natronococcus occultus SP4]
MSTYDFESSDGTETETVSASSGTSDRLERAEARAELLAEENRRLRAQHARARRSKYRRTALGLVAIGLCAVAGGVIFPDSRELLLALGATGLFGGLLTYYLTPEQFVAASVGERVYAAWAANGESLAAELGLREDRVYVPDERADTARLYVPARAEFEPPTDADGPVVVDRGSHGLLVAPTGATLFEEFERVLSGDLASRPEPLAVQLADGVVEQFELADGADPDVDAAGGRVTVGISGSAFGAVDRFDHPIASFLAVGLAVGLDRPVVLAVEDGDDRADWLVTCRFEPDEDVAGNENEIETETEADAADDGSDEETDGSF